MPSVRPSSTKMPILRQMASAVFLLSPVIMMTLMPACLQSLMAGEASILGGLSIPTMATKVRLTSYWANLVALWRSQFLEVRGRVAGGEGEAAEGVPAGAVLNGAVHDLGPQLLSHRYLLLAHPDVDAPLQHALGGALDKHLGPLADPGGLLGGVQKLDMLFLSLENSRVKSLFHLVSRSFLPSLANSSRFPLFLMS